MHGPSPLIGAAAHRSAPVRLGLFAAVVVGALLALAGPALAQSTTAIKVDEVRRQTMDETAPVIGRLVARQAGVVAARVGAPVTEMRVEVGDRVQAGDVVALLDADRLRAVRDLRAAEVDEARARIATSEAELKLARQTLKRIEGLRGSAAFQQARYDDQVQQVKKWEATLIESKARLAQARANSQLAEIDLARTRIHAPFPGAVAVRHIDAGAYADTGDEVITLINDRTLEIEADVPSDYIDTIPADEALPFTLDGRKFRARLRAIVPEENPRTRTRAVRFTPDFGDASLRLAVNQSLTLRLPTGREREVVTVDKDAVIPRRGQDIVFVVQEGVARQKAVRLGPAVGHRFVVEQGLQPGDRVVVRGNERLRDGQPVTVESAS